MHLPASNTSSDRLRWPRMGAPKASSSNYRRTILIKLFGSQSKCRTRAFRASSKTSATVRIKTALLSVWFYTSRKTRRCTLKSLRPETIISPFITHSTIRAARRITSKRPLPCKLIEKSGLSSQSAVISRARVPWMSAGPRNSRHQWRGKSFLRSGQSLPRRRRDVWTKARGPKFLSQLTILSTNRRRPRLTGDTTISHRWRAPLTLGESMKVKL